MLDHMQRPVGISVSPTSLPSTRCKSFISWKATCRCGSSWRTRDATCIRWSARSTSRRKCWSPFRLLLTSLMHGRSWTGNAWIRTPSEWPLPWETAPFKTMVRQTLVFAFPCKWTAPCQRPSLFWHPVCASLSLYNFHQNKPVNKDLVLRLHLYQFCCFHEKWNNRSWRTTENTSLKTTGFWERSFFQVIQCHNTGCIWKQKWLEVASCSVPS